MLTINLDNIAFMPCNPSVGGPPKGIVVREIDALGGQMAKAIDKTHIQMRMLNTGKGPKSTCVTCSSRQSVISTRNETCH